MVVPIIESYTVSNSSLGTSHTVITPAGIQNNDILLIIVSLDGDSGDAQSVGFEQFGAVSQSTTELFYLIKRADNESGNYNVTWTGNERGRFTIFRISGVRQVGNAIDAVDIIGVENIGAANTANVPAIISTEADTLAICAVSVDRNVVDDTMGFSDAQGFTVNGEPDSGFVGGAGQIIGSKGLPSIGSSLSPTFGTWTNDEGFATRMFNLKPSVSAVSSSQAVIIG